MASRQLNITWTNKVEIWRDGDCMERPAVWEGVNQDGTRVKVYISKIEELDGETNHFHHLKIDDGDSDKDSTSK